MSDQLLNELIQSSEYSFVFSLHVVKTTVKVLLVCC